MFNCAPDQFFRLMATARTACIDNALNIARFASIASLRRKTVRRYVVCVLIFAVVRLENLLMRPDIQSVERFLPSARQRRRFAVGFGLQIVLGQITVRVLQVVVD